MATVPSDLGKPGDLLTIYVSVLTREDFVASIPQIVLTNDFHFSWLPASTTVEGFTLEGDHLTIKARQSPVLAGTSNFSFEGKASGSLGFVPGVRSYLQFDVTDFQGQARTFRVYYDGHSPPWLGLARGTKFPPISHLADDGYRLRMTYNYQSPNVATIYLRDPSTLYKVAPMEKGGLWFQVNGASDIYTIRNVEVLRQTENSMLTSAESYAVGRVGAEVAYTVDTQKLGLTDLIMQDPSASGPDLFTKDGKVFVEARMLSQTSGASQAQLTKPLQTELQSMVGRLQSDFGVYKTASYGYVILSYLDQQGAVETIILKVLRA